MALHAAAVAAKEPWATEIADVCARAEVDLLRYPVPADLQAPGQTMAVGAISKCLKQYGADTLITALQCVTQTENNTPGMLSSRMIKALCEVLHDNPAWRDGGLALLEIFHQIDLDQVHAASGVEPARRNMSRVTVVADEIKREVERVWTVRRQLAAE
jgi:hypothetical protein